MQKDILKLKTKFMKLNKIVKPVLLFISLLFLQQMIYSQKYKDMMNDNTINFYDVVKEAESYFKTIDVNAKGSGYKQFMRWATSNEYKYYPSGNRLAVDPEFAIKAHKKNVFNKSIQFNKSNVSDGWREIGPFAIENITVHYAAGMGRVEDFYVDPNNAQNIYICSRSGGLWKTTNEGTTWSSSSTETLPASGVNSIAVDPLNFNHVYVALQNANNNYSFGVYESLDGGASFNETGFNPTNLGLGGLGSSFRIYTVVHHPTIGDLLLVGTSNGLYKTTNNFSSWEQITSGYIVQIEFHPINDNIMYVYDSSQRNVVYVSNDTANTFSTTTINDNNNASATMAVTANAPNELYFASNSGIFKSTDAGSSFSFISNSFTTNSLISTDAFAVNSTNNQNLFIGGVDGANSTDGGINFTKRTDWYLGASIHGSGTLEQRYFNSTAYVHADLRTAKSLNGHFYVATDGTLAKSEDGGVTWQNLMQTNAPGIRENYKLGISQSNNNVAISGSQDNGTSIKNPTGWVEAYGADGMEGIISPLNPEYMIGSYQFGGRIRTLDAGTSNTIVTSNGTNGWWEAPLAYDPNDQFKIYDFRNGVYVSTDFGLNYNYVGTPSFLSSSYWDQIRNAEIAQNNSNIIIVSKASEIEKSTDGGAIFFDIKNNLPNHEIQDIAINPNDDDDIIVVNASYQNNGQKVYRSTNGGTSWSNITYNIGDIPVHTVVIDHTNNPNIYIGTEVGVYYKALNGTSWTLYNTGLPNVAVQELEINYGANTIKAATWGRGLWEYDLVGRDIYPSIESTSITNPPSLNAPFEGSNQFVTSVIKYSGTLTDVRVNFSINNQLLDNIINMTNIDGNTWVSDEALPNSTIVGDKVFFKVFATGSNTDTSETYKFMYEVQDLSYCDSQGKDGTTTDYITQVSLGNFVNNSEQNYYTLYDDLEPIQLIVGETYQLSVELDSSFDLDKAAVWIDFNRNGVFDDSELINMSEYTNHISNGSVTVPNDAVLGQTHRMRVRNIYDNTITPCDEASGEVEDYVITVINPIISFNTVTSTITENTGDQIVFIPVTMYNHTEIPTSVSILTSGTANTTDYTLHTSSLTFYRDETQHIALTIKDDADTENETIVLTLTETTNIGVTIAASVHTISIIDDDIPIIINEILADPNGIDANGDGIISSDHDEFIEFVNLDNVSYDLTGYTVSDDANVRYTFGSVTIPAGGSVVIFGGGTPTGIPGISDTTSSLGLSNSGDTVSLKNAEGTTVATYTYGSEANSNQSIGRVDDTTGSFVEHETITTNPVSASPGRRNVSNLPFIPVTWNGSANNDWTTDANWTPETIPIITSDIVIPSGLSTYPTATSAVIANTVSIESGASLIATNIFIAHVTYNRDLANGNQWYLMSSPVVGEIYNDIWIDENSIASGQFNNRGLSWYDNTSSDIDNGFEDTATGNWRYLQSGNNGTFNKGQGYGVYRSGIGTVSFKGSGIYTSSQTFSITQGASTNYSLVGNPFTSYLNLGDFFVSNPKTSVLVESEAYFWNGSAYGTKTSGLHGAFEIAPGQGFFVEANNNIDVTFDINDVSHQSTDSFLKTGRPKINLFITDDTYSNYADIYYIEGKTTGFDSGYDGKLFGGVTQPLTIYTHLVSDGGGEKYQIQSLPTSNYENMVIPIGVDVTTGKEITFTANANNLPVGIKVFLEDRQENTFIRLDQVDSNYKVIFNNAVNGVGRFYLHTTSNVLSIDNDLILNSLTIFKSDETTLRIVGLPQGETTISLFNILGKQMIRSSFNSNGVKEISLQKLTTGIYFVQVQTETGKVSKKIILE